MVTDLHRTFGPENVGTMVFDNLNTAWYAGPTVPRLKSATNRNMSQHNTTTNQPTNKHNQARLISMARPGLTDSMPRPPARY